MIGRDTIANMLRGGAREVKAHRDELSKLDSVGGDGDHGVTMLRAMESLEKVLDESPASNVKELLSEVGWAVMGVDGGATGPLFGSFFLGMAEGAREAESVDVDGLIAMCEAGLAAVQKRTRAEVGDKTMMDALMPAVEALGRRAADGADEATVLSCAADAAEQGAVSTKDLRARFGRAKNVGEKSVGHQDPGATSVYLMFRGFSQGVQSHAR